MLENNEGHIINVASIAGFLPGPYMCTYHATKGYVVLLGEAISHELRKTKVKQETRIQTATFLSLNIENESNLYSSKGSFPA